MNFNDNSIQEEELWSKIFSNSAVDNLLQQAVQQAAYSLTDILNRFIEVRNFQIETYPLSYVTNYTSNLEAETIGIYLNTGQNLPGQAILIISIDDALYLADLLLEIPPGTTMMLTELEYSALGEIGNLTLSAFLNSIVKITGSTLHPSPPVTRTDMLGTILEAAIAPVAMITNELLIIETDFINVESGFSIRFWILPDPSVLTRYK